MKITMLACTAMLCAATAQAQLPENRAYAITSEQKGSFDWTEVKMIDLSNGSVVSNVFENSKHNYAVIDGRTSREIKLRKTGDSLKADDRRPFAGLSAACAYDSKHNRLYFAPMFLNELRYIDLGAAAPNVYLFNNQPLSEGLDMGIEANQMTRMVIASDGNGYALNNDGSHLVRFTTAAQPEITDLGAVTDAPENGDIKIDDANTSWGGDLLADASGNLYVISARNHVFKIDLQTRVATHLAEIKGLPEGFTTNGAVVSTEGNVVLSSANFITAYYSVDPQEWAATVIPASEEVYNASDLANERLLFQTKLAAEEKPVVPEQIAVYPNPVKTNVFRVSFQHKEAGLYSVELVDVSGKLVSAKSLSVSSAGQVTEVKVSPSLTRGVYMVKVLNRSSNEVYLQKVVLE